MRAKIYGSEDPGSGKLSDSLITGSVNQKINTVLDHANSEQHKTVLAGMRADHARASNKLCQHTVQLSSVFQRLMIRLGKG